MSQPLVALLIVKIETTVSELSSPTRWYEDLARYQQKGTAHVLATIIAVNGSAPRALQSKMVITADACCDTLGGGGLEHDVTMTARQLLSGEIAPQATKDTKKAKTNRTRDTNDSARDEAAAVRRDSVYTKHYPLGARLAQCCGGSVTVMFECFNIIPPLSILVFGAGHVAAALMTILADLPCQVDWVDSRAEMFARYLPQASGGDANTDVKTSVSSIDAPDYELPAHIRVHVDEEPVDFVAPFIASAACKNSPHFILVMTHDHALDFDLVRAAVDANMVQHLAGDVPSELPYIGCISSATKSTRFKERLRQRGYSELAIDMVIMPIGLPIGGKEPMAVAVSIAAQVLQQYHERIEHH